MGEIKEQRVRESAAEATSWKDFAARLGYTYQTARSYAKKYDLNIPDGRIGLQSGTPAQEKRNRDIWHRRFVLNHTLQSIAEDYGISRQRVLAIFKREQKRLAREV
tara:strand:+ start:165 stop:482 length:318 start_codon:yes stop_codon:yes gene_type:complete